ncbi:MAG: YjfB family protein [Pseudomonadota bacterium]
MEINNLTAYATDVHTARMLQSVDIAMQKKAMEIQEQAAAQLVQAIPRQPNPEVNPPNLGQNVDYFA